MMWLMNFSFYIIANILLLHYSSFIIFLYISLPDIQRTPSHYVPE